MIIARLLVFGLLAYPMTAQQTNQDQAVEYARRVISHEKSVVPVSGYVSDSDTAIAIAKAVLIPIYGKNIGSAETPWKAGLENGVWTVVGTFNGKGAGGEAMVQIDKKTGAIKFVGHTM